MTDKKTMYEALIRFGEAARALESRCRNNEFQTRVSLVNPFLERLGYDSRDPDVVRMEYTADIGKAGEKVDYAIFREGDPYIFIEVKSTEKDIRDARFSHQLARYVVTEPKIRFAALTNGVLWRWHRCADPASRVMEERPFITHDVFQPNGLVAEWLWSVSGHQKDPGQAERQAQSAFVRQSVVDWIEATRRRPSDGFVRLLAKEKELGTVGKKNLEAMRTDVRFALDSYIEGEIDRVLEAAGRRAERELATTNERDGSGDGVGASDDPGRSGGFAWRIRGEDWRPEKNGRDLQIAVTRYLASLHCRGLDDFYRSARMPHGKRYFHESPPDPTDPKQYRTVDSWATRYWVNVNLSTKARRTVLDRLCRQVETRDGSPVRLGTEIEVRMPGL